MHGSTGKAALSRIDGPAHARAGAAARKAVDRPMHGSTDKAALSKAGGPGRVSRATRPSADGPEQGGRIGTDTRLACRERWRGHVRKPSMPRDIRARRGGRAGPANVRAGDRVHDGSPLGCRPPDTSCDLIYHIANLVVQPSPDLARTRA
ncbi:hypothetical protein GCM10009533_47510 [Saccharopolyspora spinosporotrichia]